MRVLPTASQRNTVVLNWSELGGGSSPGLGPSSVLSPKSEQAPPLAAAFRVRWFSERAPCCHLGPLGWAGGHLGRGKIWEGGRSGQRNTWAGGPCPSISTLGFPGFGAGQVWEHLQVKAFSARRKPKVLSQENRLAFPPCRLFGGLVLDVKRKAPWFWSDFRDGLSLQCLASFLFLYCACMSPVITFGGLLGEATHGHIVSFSLCWEHGEGEMPQTDPLDWGEVSVPLGSVWSPNQPLPTQPVGPFQPNPLHNL